MDEIELLNYNPTSLLADCDPTGILEHYYELLAAENRRINLVSRETLPDPLGGASSFTPLRFLAAESLLPITLLDTDRFPRYLDIGSGGGFPSIPIILTRIIGHPHLVERTQKKAGALRRILLALGKQADISPDSFESLLLEPDSFDLITLRLVKPTSRMLDEILALLSPGGAFVYYSLLPLPLDTTRFTSRAVRYAPETGDDLHSATIIHRIP